HPADVSWLLPSSRRIGSLARRRQREGSTAEGGGGLRPEPEDQRQSRPRGIRQARRSLNQKKRRSRPRFALIALRFAPPALRLSNPHAPPHRLPRPRGKFLP